MEDIWSSGSGLCKGDVVMKLLRVYMETGETYIVSYDQKDNKDTVKMEEGELNVEFLGRGTRENEYLFKVGNEVHSITIDRGFLILDQEEEYKVDRITELPVKEGQSVEELMKGKEGEVLSPLQGRVVAIRVKEGDAVTKGQPLLSVEAMKSETIISAPIAGVIEKIAVKPGQGVKKGDLLVVLK